jgi:transcription initiation factor TFIID subunit 1
MILISARTWRKHGGIDTSPSIPLHDRSFDLVLLSNWEDQITYETENDQRSAEQTRSDLMAPVNKGLESGAWTQSIIWSPRTPFRDFTQIEFNNGDDIIPEERPPGSYLSSRTLIMPHCFTSPGIQT